MKVKQQLLTYLFMILLVQNLGYSTRFRLGSEYLQDAYNKQICTQCHDLFASHCKQNMRFLREHTKMNITHSSPIGDSKVKSVDFKRIQFDVTVSFPSQANSTTFKTSGLVVLPLLDAGQQLNGTIAYFRPTQLNNQHVPSNANQTSPYFLAMAALYTSLGYAVVMPDLIGMGIDYQNIHPYVLFPVQNAQTMAYALDYSLQLLRSQYTNIAYPIPTYSVGYSEGGSYALFFYLCQKFGCKNYKKMNKNFFIKKTVGIQGAFDLDMITLPYLTSNVSKHLDGNRYRIRNVNLTNLFKPALTALTVASYVKYGNSKINLENQLNDTFYKMRCTPVDLQELCNAKLLTRMNIQEALAQKGLPNTKFGIALGSSAGRKRLKVWEYASIGTYETSSMNNVKSFVQQRLFDAQFNSTVEEATVSRHPGFKSVQKNQMMVVSLDFDSVVSPLNADRIQQANGNITKILINGEKIKVCEGIQILDVDHLHAEAFGHAYAASFFHYI